SLPTSFASFAATFAPFAVLSLTSSALSPTSFTAFFVVSLASSALSPTSFTPLLSGINGLVLDVVRFVSSLARDFLCLLGSLLGALYSLVLSVSSFIADCLARFFGFIRGLFRGVFVFVLGCLILLSGSNTSRCN